MGLNKNYWWITKIKPVHVISNVCEYNYMNVTYYFYKFFIFYL